MDSIDKLRRLGLFDTRVPRYTSYPTAPNFTPAVGSALQADWLRAADPAVSVYVHVPFCERLCWFCACHTQGTRTLTPVEHYVDALEVEIARAASLLPAGVRMGRLHWGGGTPTILSPTLIHRLAQAIRRAIPPADVLEFSVEIDPTAVDGAKIAALAAEGLNRASLGIQDFDPLVQGAIGRRQSFAATRDCVAMLRSAGVASINADLVYGLPHQTEARLDETIAQVLTLAPDRVALYGYAHVPWASKRQALIDETALPGDLERYHLASLAAERFTAAGLERIGIDHFARAGDGLFRAARTGRLRRNFQGYTDDTCPTLIGFGASAVSRYPHGYVQNAPAAAAWHQAIATGGLAGAKGFALSPEDVLRGRAIEMLLCDFRIDTVELSNAFGPAAATLAPVIAETAQRYAGLVEAGEQGFVILPEGWPLARIIASAFDGYLAAGGRFSRAS